MAVNFPIRSYEEWCRYTDLVRAVEKARINVADVFAQIPQKREMLKFFFDYSHLRGSRGDRIPIEECQDKRIGRAFQNQYNFAKKKLREQRLLEFEIACEQKGETARRNYQGCLFNQ